jgi:hypothetical protein
MNEDRFDELMRDAVRTYNSPPETPLDEMWQAIEERRDLSVAKGGRRRSVPWLQIAAALVVGIGIGRGSMMSGLRGSAGSSTVAINPSPAAATEGVHVDTAMSEAYQVATTRYLGQTAALLIALPSEVRAGRADQQFVARASDLLATTRLLIDSPASNEQSMRNLLEDLELVLTQVVRLHNNRSRFELDLINRALEQRDVIPRLRTAVADISAD